MMTCNFLQCQIVIKTSKTEILWILGNIDVCIKIQNPIQIVKQIQIPFNSPI